MITSAYEIPNLRFSLPAYGNVARHRFVQSLCGWWCV